MRFDSRCGLALREPQSPPSRRSFRAARQLENLMPNGACNGYWHGQPGLDQVAAMHRTAEA